MTTIKLMCRKGSNACKIIAEKTQITRHNKSGLRPDLLINYGLTGNQKNKFYINYPLTKSIPTINKLIGLSKYKLVKMVEDCGILVPKSKLNLNQADALSDWITKRFNSQGGYGIKKATHRNKIADHYYQRFIHNRQFELRIHAFSWVPIEKWIVLKRIGDKNSIAWNFSQGGHFQTIYSSTSPVIKKAKEITKSVLKIAKMEFGAVDFIVDSNDKVYFIEINSQPGLQGLSDNIYANAFNSLKKSNIRDIVKCFNH